jgi:hypothetical protein
MRTKGAQAKSLDADVRFRSQPVAAMTHPHTWHCPFERA